MAGDQYGREKKKAMVGWISGSHYDDHGSGDSTPVPVRGIGYMAAEIDGPILLPGWRERMEKSRPVRYV